MAQILDVRLQRNGDPPAFGDDIPGITEAPLAELGPIAVLENGTAGGQLAIAFIFQSKAGPTICQITERNLDLLANIARGFRKRIDDEKAKAKPPVK